MPDHVVPTGPVLVVDDEPAILRALTAALRAHGYAVLTATNGTEAIERAATEDPVALILDLGLPDIDGIEVCRRIRGWSELPIIVLTADGAPDRKVIALDGGADDYVTKPFATQELLARLRVALRHHSRAQAPVAPPTITVGTLTIDVARHRVTLEDRELQLTPKEFDLLTHLARNLGMVLTHRAILQEVWGPEYGTESQYLRVYASHLRKKLGAGAGVPRLVSEPGVGYRLVEDGDS
jgi:two-component system KDP operon response regulator KdpE